MYPIDHTFLISAIRADSARACRSCGGPIALDDGFGLSEGICRTCVSPRRLVPRRPNLIERLLRAA